MTHKIMATSELDLFSNALEEQAVSETRQENIIPSIVLPNSNTNTPLEFKIPASMDCYTDLSCTMLEVEYSIQFKANTDEEKKISTDEEIALVNNFLMTAFTGLQMHLNETAVVLNNNALPWSSYLQVLTSFPSEARDSWLSASGYCADEWSSDAISAGGKKRFKPFTSNGRGRFCGPILSAPFQMH